MNSKAKRGGVALAAGLLLLAAIVGWRVLANDDPARTEPSQPMAEGVPDLDELERRARATPEDARAWHDLGFARFNAGEFAGAAEAYRQAVKADASSAELWSALGESLVMASTADPLPVEAVAAFEKALAIDTGDARARYFMAVKKDLAGDHQGAIADWLALLADTPPGAPWETDLVRTIQQVGKIRQIAVEDRIAAAAKTRNILPAGSLVSPRGPTQEQMAAAAALTPTQQEDMAEQMVARLATRLEQDGGDIDGWIMLMRSYRQLGRLGEARRARDSAIAQNPSAKARISTAAEQLGID